MESRYIDQKTLQVISDYIIKFTATGPVGEDGDRYFICRTPNIPVKGGEKRGDSQEVVAKSRLSR
jgi:hypothetical protein